ncbi:MAG: DUF1732 domain-containing protein [Caulobacteraceae bacterium]
MSLSGMTGFARVEGAAGDWTWAVEARSVNGRALETRFRGPPGFDGLERLAREAAQARFHRGQINLAVQARRSEGAGGSRVNVEMLEMYLRVGAPLIAAGRATPPSMDGLLALRGVIEAGDESEDPQTRVEAERVMSASIAAALDGLKLARLEEGASLTGVLAGFVDRIESTVAAAEREAATQPRIIRDRFQLRLIELAGEAATPERIVQEAATAAVKADVREELDRLTGHVAAARSLLGGEAAAGRRLDFLTQEFMREANTLCAKAASPPLTRLGLDLKATIDHFREQVQNVE